MEILFSNIQFVFPPNSYAVTWTQIINRLYRTDKYSFVVAKYLLHFCWAEKTIDRGLQASRWSVYASILTNFSMPVILYYIPEAFFHVHKNKKIKLTPCSHLTYFCFRYVFNYSCSK